MLLLADSCAPDRMTRDRAGHFQLPLSHSSTEVLGNPTMIRLRCIKIAVQVGYGLFVSSDRQTAN